jgi:hypothetical protein
MSAVPSQASPLRDHRANNPIIAQTIGLAMARAGRPP